MDRGRFAARFDSQAEYHDKFASLPEDVCLSVVRGLKLLAGLQRSDLVVEVGVGSGQLSRWLCREPITYIGFDISRSMLDICARKIAPSRGDCLLLQADGERPWPIGSERAKLVFASRSLHLLSPVHVVSEVLRIVSRMGGALIVGRVKRTKEGIHERTKRELMRLLRTDGWSVVNGEEHQASVIELLVQHGATSIDPLVAGSWSIATTPGQLIAGWEIRRGLAGLDVPQSLKNNYLAVVRTWAEEVFGGLDASFTDSVCYVLSGARMSLKTDELDS